MNRYVTYYDNQKLEELDFKKPGKKALLYGFSAIVIGIFGCFLAPLANLNIYSEGNLFFFFFFGLIIFGICFSSFLKLKRLHIAKLSALANVKEIEEKLFVENLVLPDETLIGITKDNQLFIMGRNKKKEYFTFLATHNYLHFSPAHLGEKQEIEFEQVLQGKKEFYVIKESL